MAGLYKLPILYVLENNQYAMGTALNRSTGQKDFVLKARAHGIQGERVDGMDAGTVLDRSTFQQPQLISLGIKTVFVNGVAVWQEEKISGNRPGRALRHQTRPTTQ